MKLKQLNEQLEQALELHHQEVVSLVDCFHAMTRSEQEYMLPQVIDDINRQSFYTFVEFKDNLIKYLEEVER